MMKKPMRPFILCAFALAIASVGYTYAECLEHDLIIAENNKLGVNWIQPVSVGCDADPCECDPHGLICIDGNVKVRRDLLVNTIAPMYTDACGDCFEDFTPEAQTCLTSDVNMQDDLSIGGELKVAEDLTINEDLVVCGDMRIKGELSANIENLETRQLVVQDTEIGNLTFGSQTVGGLKIGDKRIIGQKEVHIDNNVLGSEALRIVFTQINRGAFVNIAIFGRWPDHGQVFFRGTYYLSTDGLDIDIVSQGSRHIGNYAGIFDTTTRFTGSPNEFETASVETPLGPAAYSGGNAGIAVLNLRNFGVSLFDDGFDGILYYDVTGDDIFSVE